MKRLKWGIILLMIIGLVLSSCAKQEEKDPDPEIIPELFSEVIESDIQKLQDLPKDLIRIIDQTYTVTKVSETHSRVEGTLEIEMTTYDMTCSFQINYYYFNKAWIKESEHYNIEHYQNIRVQPDLQKMNELAFEYVNSWPPQEVYAEDFRVLDTVSDLKSGMIKTRYEYDERWGPLFITYDIYMVGTFDPVLGWTYQYKLTENPVISKTTYSGTKKFTWATISAEEDFIKIEDQVEVTLTGVVKTIIPNEGTRSTTIEEPLIASLTFKGKTVNASAVLTTVESFGGAMGVELRWGEGTDEVFVFIYGLKNEENAQFPFFYVISNDGSISEMSY
ncbi:MAG: hypothetical protein HGB31_02570 [Erysipelotrichaceae bacterium]|nr:hypothetical protein [Erysipelotrichaceae bacterium]